MSTSKKDSSFTMHVISHTHWDREWYRPFQLFRMRLVDLMDQLIKLMQENPDYKFFHLDGQTIMLDDYLQIRPENEPVLRQLVKDGRILIGPWYNQPDEFLVSAEAMVRNLALGRRMGDDWGNWMRIGYVPDCFGHISQFPQIMRGFGIDNAVLFRGITTDQVKSEFTWRSPDGSEVLCVKLPDDNAYSNFYYRLRDSLALAKGDTGTRRHGDAATGTSSVLSPEQLDHVRQEIRDLVNDCINEKPTTEHLLFMDGVDHIFANPLVPAIIKDANDNLGIGTMIHSTLPDFVAAVNASNPELETVEGELRISNRKWKLQAVLAGVMSSRVHLKQANHELQTLMEKWAEPFCTIAWTLGKDYPKTYLELAWKYLLKNHPHDSICGCSVDQVHKDMVYRFDQARLIAGRVVDLSLLYVADRVDTRGSVGANGESGQPSAVSDQPGAKERPTSNGEDADAGTRGHGDTANLGGGEGATPESPNPQSEIRNPKSVALVVFNPLSWERSEVVEAEVNFPHDWNATGLVVTDSDGNEVPFQVLAAHGGSTFDQEWYDIPMGTPTHYRKIVFLAEGVPSVGYKTYYVQALSTPYRTPGSMMTCADTAVNEFIAVSVCENGSLNIHPETGDVQESWRTMIFEDGGDFGDGWNYRKPQRDTVVYSTANQAQVSVVHDGPIRATFKIDMVMKVPARMNPNGLERSKETVDMPITSYVMLTKGSARVDITTEVDNTARDHRLRVRFPVELDAEFSNAESLYDVVTRPIKVPECRDWKEPMPVTHPQKSFVDVSDGDSGLTIINEGLPEFEVKDDIDHTIALTLMRGVIGGVGGRESQEQGELIGKHTFRYAVYPHKGDWQQAQVWREAWAHNVPMRAVQTSIHAGDLPLTQSFLGIESPGVVLSALKKADREDRIVARVFNITESPAKSCGVRIEGAGLMYQADLNEELAGDAPIGDNVGTLDVGKKQIITLLADRK